MVCRFSNAGGMRTCQAAPVMMMDAGTPPRDAATGG
jgi:hypothetical protein